MTGGRTKKGTLVTDLLLMLGVVAVWLALQLVILPRMGVAT